MNIEDRNKRSKVYGNFRGSLHIAMGGLYLAVGIATIYLKSFIIFPLPAAAAYIVGGLFVLYGAFRIWRGWTDMSLK